VLWRRRKLEAEKATMATEKDEWEAMITEEVESLEAQLAEAKLKAEQLAALEGSFKLLQEEKAEVDEYLAEFEAASIEENEGLQKQLKDALDGKKAAEDTAANATADEEMAMEVRTPLDLSARFRPYACWQLDDAQVNQSVHMQRQAIER
jgi:hypothetical protein